MADILLIDDDPNQHELLSFYLEEAFGFSCPFVSAYNLEEALDRLCSQSFDAIFLDNRLRPHDSYKETIGAITELSNDCPIYLISAARGHEKLGDFRAHGIVDTIDKFELRQALSDGLLNPVRQKPVYEARI